MPKMLKTTSLQKMTILLSLFCIFSSIDSKSETINNPSTIPNWNTRNDESECKVRNCKACLENLPEKCSVCEDGYHRKSLGDKKISCFLDKSSQIALAITIGCTLFGFLLAFILIRCVYLKNENFEMDRNTNIVGDRRGGNGRRTFNRKSMIESILVPSFDKN